MIKLYGLVFLIAGDVLLVRYLTEIKNKRIQCLREMIGFLSGVTYGVTEWKRTLEKAVLLEQHCGTFPRLFQKHFSEWIQTIPLRDALCKSLEELPLPDEAKRVLSHYFMMLGRDIRKTTEDRYLHTKHQLEEVFQELQEELPKSKKLIAVSVYAISAMAAVLLL